LTELAGIYCRLSLAIMGDTTKVDDQERICRELADSRSWHVRPEWVWKDNGKSAWQIGVRRPGWDGMMAVATSGQMKNLITYHGDRMVRQPYDLEQLIRFADQGMTITSPTGTRQLDVPEDRFYLRILADIAEMESANTSRRKKAGFERMRRAGIAPVPGGQTGRGFGYERDGRTPHPVEAEALQNVARLVLDGRSLTEIAGHLDMLGIRSTSGAPLNYASLKRILLRPRIAGLLADGITPGNWEPVIDREKWELVRAVLLGRAEAYRDRPTGAAKYLLSGIATCHFCKRPVQRQSAGRVIGYGCVTPGCRKVHRNMELLDTYVGTRVVERLNHPGNPAGRVPEHPGLAAELVTLTGARAELRAKIEDPAQPYVDLLTTRLARVEERIAVLRAGSAGAARARLLAQHQGITWEEWLALPLATRRALTTAHWQIEVLPSGRRGPGFSAADVLMTPV